MSGKYKRKSSFGKLPVIIGLAVIIVLIVLCLVMCQASGDADPAEPTAETTIETTESVTTEVTELGEETTAATTEATTEPTTEETEPTEHRHDYAEKVTAATCTAEGYTTYTCECGDTYNGNYIAAPGHSYGEWTTTKEPTKTATGTAQRECGKCGAAESKDLPKVIEGHTHSYTSSVTTAATCSAEGVKTFTCSCGDSYTESVAKVAHDYSTAVTAATCTANGYTTYTCKNCGRTYSDDYVNAKGHRWGNWVTTKEATETSTGTAERKCSVCGEKDTKTLSKLPHTHSHTSKVTKEANCGTVGVRTYTCKCGDSYTESIPNTGSHSWGEWVTEKEPTTTSTGVARATCSVCGNTKSKVLDKLTAHTHSHTSVVTTAATCGKDGVKTYKCACGDTYTEAITKTGSHSYGEWVTTKAPTATSTGTAKRTCSVCGGTETKTLEKLTAHTHSHTSVVTTAATCSSEGVRTYTCSCGDSYTEKIAKTYHSWSPWVTIKEPTSSATGTAERICYVCDKTETKTLDKVSHTHNYSNQTIVAPTCTTDGYLHAVCSCGDYRDEVNKPATGHKYSSSESKSGCTVTKTYTCSACGDSYSDSSASHSWVHIDEVGHYEGYYVCHCGGWSGTDVKAYGAHAVASEDPASHAYYSVSNWIVDTPASDKCSVCGVTK